MRGYDSLQIGKAVFIAGVFQVLSVAPVAVLSRRIDPRVMIALGLALYGCGLFLITPLGTQWGADELFWPQAVRGFSGMFVIVPVSNLALGKLPPERLKMASGLYNLMRNLGGAVGIAAINIMLQSREPLHFSRLAEHVSARNPAALALLETLTARFGAVLDDAGRARTAALAGVNRLVHQQALAMSFADALMVMAVPVLR